MEDKELRAAANNFNQGMAGGPQTIVVRQVVGEQEQQKVLDIHVAVPERKPAIEQIVDVFVKDVRINSVDVINDKVIVRGEFEIKAIYVACLPNQPVHAVEIKHYKWTQDVSVPGARKGMDAEASVIVEFVDYDVAEMTRAYKYKHYQDMDECEDDEEEMCAPAMPAPPVCTQSAAMKPCPEPIQPQPVCSPLPTESSSEEECGTRDFDVSVVLKVTAKVMTDREVQINPMAGSLPVAPKG